MTSNTKHPRSARPFTWKGRTQSGTGLLYASGAVVVTGVDGHRLNTRCKTMENFIGKFKVSPRSITYTPAAPTADACKWGGPHKPQKTPDGGFVCVQCGKRV